LFLDQLEKLVRQVEAERTKHPDKYKTRAPAKLLKAIHEIAFNRIPGDPTDARYRQGNTLGPEYRHWLRDKFGNGRFRLFFRYHGDAKVIIYCWMNDEDSLRTYGDKNDAYAVYRKMLDGGDPPDGWADLVACCSTLESLRLGELIAQRESGAEK
jgi:toxin YhaV